MWNQAKTTDICHRKSMQIYLHTAGLDDLSTHQTQLAKLQNKTKHKMTHTRIKKLKKKKTLICDYYYPQKKTENCKPQKSSGKKDEEKRCSFPPVSLHYWFKFLQHLVLL